MGSWGFGNFDNDAAIDMTVGALEPITAEIEAFCSSDRVGVEDIDSVVACVEIHLALLAQCKAPRPPRQTVNALRGKVLRLFDEQIDQLKPTAEYKVARRGALSQALDDYAAQAGSDA